MTETKGSAHGLLGEANANTPYGKTPWSWIVGWGKRLLGEASADTPYGKATWSWILMDIALTDGIKTRNQVGAPHY